MSESSRARPDLSLGAAAWTLAAAAAAAFAGVALMYVATSFGEAAPVVALALPLVPFAVVAVVWDPRIGVALVFVSFLFGFGSVPIGPFRLQPAELATLAVLALVALGRTGSGRTPFVWTPRQVWAVALVAWAVAVSFPHAPDQSLAVKQMLAFLAGVLFLTLIASVASNMRDVRLLARVLVVVGGVVAATASTGAAELRTYYSGAVVEGRLQGIFTEPNELGSFCAMLFLLAVGLLLGARSWREKLVVGAAAALLLFALALSLSRGAWIGAIVGMIVLLVTVLQARRTAMALVLPALAAAAVLNVAVAATPQVQVVGDRARALTKIDQPYEGRPAIWSEAVARSESIRSPAPGRGTSASRAAASPLPARRSHTGHAHNLYLNVGAELGLVALGFLGALGIAIALATREALRSFAAPRWRAERALVAGIAAALTAYAVQAMTNTFVRNPVLDATVWGLIGLLLVAHGSARRAATRR